MDGPNKNPDEKAFRKPSKAPAETGFYSNGPTTGQPAPRQRHAELERLTEEAKRAKSVQTADIGRGVVITLALPLVWAVLTIMIGRGGPLSDLPDFDSDIFRAMFDPVAIAVAWETSSVPAWTTVFLMFAQARGIAKRRLPTDELGSSYPHLAAAALGTGIVWAVSFAALGNIVFAAEASLYRSFALGILPTPAAAAFAGAVAWPLGVSARRVPAMRLTVAFAPFVVFVLLVLQGLSAVTPLPLPPEILPSLRSASF